MLRLALWGLVIVTVAGILAAVILIVARAIVAMLLIALFLGAIYLALKLVLRAFRRRGPNAT